MSYDLGLIDPITGATLELDAPHQMKGGTYCLGGCATASINITYNYSEHFYRVIPALDPESDEDSKRGGIRSIYGLTGAESIPVLEKAVAQLGDDVSKDYWESTEGNAKQALLQCLALARMRPDGMWAGD
jgi:hypothetical protein